MAEGGAKKAAGCPGPEPMPTSAARDLVERIAREAHESPHFSGLILA